ncbi:MAG TPA: dTDP-4-dehydrorhamnose 3,5-epimerase [Rhodospirillales bacterium]|nr:dTDP-4-dehydrorhamnose 3,5-epimerase [Rhodospirillales bacterium]
MKFTPQAIPEVILIAPKVHGDTRGYFVETFRLDKFEEAIGYQVNFIQDNESKSSKGVLRGLHFQRPPFAQSKMVTVIEGEVLDVAVDIRQGSLTYGKAVTVVLNEQNKHQLFVPRGFAHGFVVLSESATFTYKVDNYYSPEYEKGVAYNDPKLNIDWRLPIESLRLSEKDRKYKSLVESGLCFEYGVNYYA